MFAWAAVLDEIGDSTGLVHERYRFIVEPPKNSCSRGYGGQVIRCSERFERVLVYLRSRFYMPGWETPKASKDILTVHCGFVTDYIAEAFRVLRKDNRFDEVERHYRFGSHVEGRDATATKKTVSAFLKLIHPDGEYTLEELQTYLELALEGRRRVKEQLKKRWSFEFYKTSFSYIGKDDGTERTVAVPEQGGKGAISQDPLPPGSLYTVATDAEGKVGLFRLEASLTAGTGKIRAPAGLEKGLKESLNRAVSYLQLVKEKLGLTLALAQKDSRLRALLAKPSTEKTSKVPEQAGIQTPPKNIPPPNAPGPPKPGHGRHSAQAYGGARRIRIVHASLKPGDRCPECQKGKVYEQKEPALRIRVVG